MRLAGPMRLAVASVMLSLCATACPAKLAPARALPTGGTLRAGAWLFGGDLDPTSAWVQYPMYEVYRCCLVRTLLSYSGQPPERGGTKLQPDLADGLPTVSADGLTWTFHLQAGIRYAPPFERIEITAQDIARALERALAPAPAFLRPGLQGGILGGQLIDDSLRRIIGGAQEYATGKSSTLSGIEVPDRRTLIVHLVHPDENLAYAFAFPQTAPIPANPAAPSARFGVAEGHEDMYGHWLVASGPYMIEGADAVDFSKPPVEQSVPIGVRSHTLTLVRNPSWRRSTDHLRGAYVDKIVLTALDGNFNDPKSAVKVERNELDVLMDWSAETDAVAKYQGNPGSGVSLSSTDSTSVTNMPINIAIPPFDDVRVRKAVALALDRDAILKAFTSIRHETAVVTTHMGFNSDEGNLLAGFDPFGPEHHGNLAAAKREMAMSRYDRNHDGVCDAPACSPVRMTVRSGRPERPKIAAIVKANLARIGLGVRVEVLNDDTFNKRFLDPRAHIALQLLQFDRDYPSSAITLPELFSAEYLAPTCCDLPLIGASKEFLGSNGYAVTNVPSVDDRVANCRTKVFDTAVRCWAELDAYVTEQLVAYVPLLIATQWSVASRSVQTVSLDVALGGNPKPALDQIVLTPEARGATPIPLPSSSPLPTTFPALPNGTYRTTITHADAAKTGINDWPGAETWTLTISNGHFQWIETNDAGDFVNQPVSVGAYYGAGDRVTFAVQAPANNATAFDATWRSAGSSLAFTLQRAEHPDDVVFFRLLLQTHPWRKIA